MSSNNISFRPPRGMRDFYPEDMVLRNRIFDAWSQAAMQYGFEHYDTCVVESLDLIKRKAGEEITEQIYAFKDKSDRDLALRAEMTPSLARMVAARQEALSYPIKWFTIAQCFRYERATKGRKREHYQWNIDVIGEDSVAAEAEVIATACRALDMLGLGTGNVIVHISSRALLSDLLASIGIGPEHHSATFLALDKLGKLDKNKITELLSAAQLPPEVIDRVFQLSAIADMAQAQEALGAETPALTQLKKLFELLDIYGLSDDAIAFDISIVRGLGYYTGVVFEAFDAAKELRAVFGGGRYDNLLGDIGGKPLSGVGLGFGDVVISELLTRDPSSETDRRNSITVGYMEDGQATCALRTAELLRSQGKNVNLALKSMKAKSFFSRADKGGYAEAIYIGPDDIEKGAAKVKSLADRTQREMVLPPNL